MIPYIHPSPFAEASLQFLIALVLSGEKPPCGAEPRIELGPALQQADVLPTEPRRTTANHCNRQTWATIASSYLANWSSDYRLRETLPLQRTS